MARAATNRPDPGRAGNRRPGGRADIDEPDEQAGEEEAPKSSKRMWIVIAVVTTLLLLGGGGAAAYFFVVSDDDPLGLFGANPERAEQAAQRRPPIYYGMDPAFVTNVSGTGGRRFMQVSVQLMARDPEVIAAVERHEPVVRNDLTMLLSDQTLESVDTTRGKEELRQEALQAIRGILRANDEPDDLENLFFTSFIVQ